MSSNITAQVVGMKIVAAGASDQGLRRRANEDSFVSDGELGLYLVADGMGGHVNGALASQTVTQDLPEGLRRLRGLVGDNSGPEYPQNLLNAIRTVNNRLYAQNESRGFGSGQGMGTTLAGILMHDGAATVFHVGDCRVYRYRDGGLRPLTRDHTLYQRWKDEGAQGVAPRRSIVLRAVGPWHHIDVDISHAQLEPGDLYLICSDGLTDMVGDEAIARILADTRGGTLEEACQALIGAANANGGQDNVTVLLVSVQAA